MEEVRRACLPLQTTLAACVLVSGLQTATAKTVVQTEPATLPTQEPMAPWRPRWHKPPKGMPALGMALVDQSLWPAEPVSPTPVAQARFVAALRQLCGPHLRRRHARRYARSMLQFSEEFGVDPFLLGALTYRHSRCVPTPRPGHRGGLITIHWREHARFIRKRAYHYWVLLDGAWIPQTREMRRFRFTPAHLRRSEPSLYFAAAILSIYNNQCPDIDNRFGSVPHRHPVSHMVWGDKVQDAGAEERILTDRRRMIAYYLKWPPRKVGSYGALPLYCPLDGAPRKVTSGLGAIRGDGHHAHRGVDFETTRGEPVRAVADGTVFRSGVDLPRRGSRPLKPERAHYFRRSRMGRGGLFVLIQHAENLTSAYMHLDRLFVRDGEKVVAGQLVGTVGRTGIKRDPAHLHFELRRGWRPLDPIPLLGASVFPPEASFLGRRIMAAQPKLWRRARYRRWRRRQARKRRLKKRQARRRRAKPVRAAKDR
jgi:hypothetical protein